NCLRDRKQAQQESRLKLEPRNLTVGQQTDFTKQVAKNTPSSNPITLGTRSEPGVIALPVSRDPWTIITKPAFRKPPKEVGCFLGSMKVDGDPDSPLNTQTNVAVPQVVKDAATPPSCRKRGKVNALLSSSPAPGPSRSRSATPISDWPASEAPQPSHEPTLSHRKGPQVTESSSYPKPPTPAQRTARSKLPSLPPSSPPSPSQNTLLELPTQLAPSISLPSMALETVILHSFTLSPPTHTRREVARKVPRPPQPVKPNRSLADPIILAPNSDNSHSQSQSQSQSHTQSLTQSQSQSQNQELRSSQPVVLSQLPVLRKRPPAEPLAQSESSEPEDEDSSCVPDSDPLFTQAFEEYDVDDSSPIKPAVKHKERARTINTEVPTYPPSDHSHTEDSDDGDLVTAPAPQVLPENTNSQKREEGDLAEACLVVEPAVTQQVSGDISSSEVGERGNEVVAIQDSDVDMDGVLETVNSTQEPNDWNGQGSKSLHEQKISPKLEESVDIAQNLDDDDTQIHLELFGASLAPEGMDRVATKCPEVGEKHPSGPTRTRSKETENGAKADNTPGSTGLQIKEVQHDSYAWAAPAFLQPNPRRAGVGRSKQPAVDTNRPLATHSSSVLTPHSTKSQPILNGRVSQDKICRAPQINLKPSQPPQEGTSQNAQRPSTSKNGSLPLAPRLLYPTQSSKRSRDLVSDADETEDASPNANVRRKKRRRLNSVYVSGEEAATTKAQTFESRTHKRESLKSQLSPDVPPEDEGKTVGWIYLLEILAQTLEHPG
ncbi:hypothetical protein H0H81_011630, partial [Sphagnurus paluster]